MVMQAFFSSTCEAGAGIGVSGWPGLVANLRPAKATQPDTISKTKQNKNYLQHYYKSRI